MHNIEIYDCEQNGEYWDSLRVGCITSSAFKDVIAGGKGLTRAKYMRQIAGERITGNKADSFYGDHMARGHDIEDNIVELYEKKTGNLTQEVGFVLNTYGCSPDRLVGDVGLLECKSALAHIQIERLLADRLPTEHKAQVQGQMLVTVREWVDFVSYCPGLPLFVFREVADAEYQNMLLVRLAMFEKETAAMVETLKAMF